MRLPIEARVHLGLRQSIAAAVCVTALLLTAGRAHGQGFTDDPLVPGVTPIRAVHVQELRVRIDAQRVRAGLAAFGWSEALVPGVTPIRALHFLELRTALTGAYGAFGQPAPTYTDSLAVGAIVLALDISELRTAVLSLEAIQCILQLSQTQVSVSALASSVATTVMTASACGWTAVSQLSWLTVTSGNSGSGNGTVSVQVAANDSSTSRSGTVTIAGRTFTVQQAGTGGGGSSDPSAPIVLTFRQGGIAGIPVCAAPSALSGSVNGSAITLTWAAPPSCNLSLYVIESGTSAGASNMGTATTSVTSYVIQNLPAGTYFFRVRARNASGDSVASGDISRTISPPPSCAPPSAPTGLSAAVNGGSVALSWTAPMSGCAPDSYVVEAGSTTGASNFGTFPSAGLARTINTLQTGVYYVRVRAHHSYGDSASSNEVIVSVCVSPPGPPSGLSASVSGSTVTFQWAASAGVCQATAYVGEAGTSAGASDLGTQIVQGTTYSRSDVAAGTYYARVRARNGYGDSAASNDVVIIVSSTPPSQPCNFTPDAPTDLGASVSGTTVTLWWTPPASGCVDWYIGEAGTSPGASDIRRDNVGNVTSVPVPNVSPGTYYVRVRGHNTHGDGPASNERSVTVDAPTPPPCGAAPFAPGSLTAGVFGTTINASWGAPTGGCVADSYVVDVGTASGASNVGSYPVGGTSGSVSANPGTYYGRVRALNSWGSSGPSNEVVVTVSEPPCGLAPNPPTGLDGGVSGTTVSLWWSAATSGCAATSYLVEAGSAPGASNLLAPTDVGNVTSRVVPNVPPGEYYVRVRAHNQWGDSGVSNEIHGTIAAPPCTAAPGAPTGLNSSVSGSTVTLWWNAPASGCAVTSYVAQVGSASGLSDIANSDTGSSATSGSVNNVGAGTYYVRIVSRNGYGDSAASNELVVNVGP